MNLTIRSSVATIALLFVSVVTPHVMAQANSTVPIVVVDLSKVFEKHPAFTKQMETIKAQVQAAEAELQARGKNIEARAKQLQAYTPSSPEYMKLEAETASMQAQIQADMAIKRKDFLAQEAQAYYQAYQQIKQEIKVFAESNRIGLVLRFSSEEIDPNNRQSVLQGVNQPILYNQGGLDITNYIVDRLIRVSGQTATAQAPRTGTTPRR